MSYSPKKDLLPLLLYLGLVLLFFASFLFGDLIFAFKDLSRYFYPLRFLMVEEVWAGHLPLWNPYIFCGYPLLATLQIGFFYPLSLIYYLLPFSLAFNYYIILHYFLAAAFMFFLLRQYQLDRSSAFFGGLVFAFSGYLLSVSNMNTSLSSVIWLPLVLLFFDRFIAGSGKKIFNFLLLAISMAIMLLGGEPTIIFITFLFLIAYAGAFSGSIIKFAQNLAWLVLAGLLTAGLTAVQLLPFFELSRLSDRMAITQFDMVTFRSFPPRELLTFIFPYFFGNPAQFGGLTESLLGQNYQDWLISPYIGILPLRMLFLAFSKSRKPLFFALAALAGLFLAFGKYTAIYAIAYRLIPAIAMVRYPVKYLFLTTFCLSIISAFGFSRVVNWENGARERLKKLNLFLGAAFGVLLVMALTGYFYAGKIFVFLAKTYPKNISPAVQELLQNILKFNLQSLFILTAYLLILLIVFCLAYYRKIERKTMVAVLVLITAADLFSSGISAAIGVETGVLIKPTENYEIINRDRGIFRTFYTPELQDANRIVRGINYPDALINAKDNLCANWHIPFHLHDFYGYESIQPYRLQQLYRSELITAKLKNRMGLLSQLNVKYIAATEKLFIPALKLLRHKQYMGEDSYLYANPDVLPRAYFIGGEGKVSIEAYDYDQIKLWAETKSDNRLFLADAYYPGWKAMIDGKETMIMREKELFRAIAVPAGKHQIKFVYDPLSFKIGAGISIISLLLTAVGLLLTKFGVAEGT